MAFRHLRFWRRKIILGCYVLLTVLLFASAFGNFFIQGLFSGFSTLGVVVFLVVGMTHIAHYLSGCTGHTWFCVLMSCERWRIRLRW